nr:CRISPR-associated endoribonuclease Cas6 [Marivirga aurantiaca]
MIKKCRDENLGEFDHHNFNFSGLKGQTTVSKAGLHFYSSKITVVFSCQDKKFIDAIIEALFTLPEIKLNGLTMIPFSVELEPEIDIIEEMKYICISPILLLKPEFSDETAKRFIHPLSEEFKTLLVDAICQKTDLLKNTDDIDFIPDENYIKKLEDAGKKYSRVYPLFDQDVPYEVRGYTFPFTLKAPVEVHKFLFECGIGLYNEKGFGMLDLATVIPGSKTTPYFTGQLAS